jgi:hypothetical protein
VSGQTVYTYVDNDPLDRTDPSGNEGVGCWNNGTGCAPQKPPDQEKTPDQQKMQNVRAVGKDGEKQAGVDPNAPKERVESRTGTAAYRIPDESDKSTIKETKNVQEFKITNQIKDFVKEAKESLREFTIKLRENTKIGPSAKDFIDEHGIKIERPITARPMEIPVVEPVVKIEIPIIP